MPSAPRPARTPTRSRRRRRAAFASTALLLAAATSPLAATAPPRVVATLGPLHSLVAGVSEGVLTPHLLLPGGTSPHIAVLRPSDARALADADLVIWVGAPLEAFLGRALGAPVAGRRVIEVLRTEGIRIPPARSAGLFDLGAPAPDAKADSDVRNGHDIDPHLWLDPANAGVIVRESARTLADMDPANAARYLANAEALAARIAALDTDIAARLAPLRGVPYVVFHDAYQGFERRYGLRPLGAVTVHPGHGPGAARLRALREGITGHGVRCVFREPQFEPRLARTVVEGTGARLAVLDPLGADLPPGPDAWFTMMRGLADALVACLSAREAPGGGARS